MDAANCAAVLLSVPINYHFHGCTALLVALIVVSGAILNTHLYLYLYLCYCPQIHNVCRHLGCNIHHCYNNIYAVDVQTHYSYVLVM